MQTSEEAFEAELEVYGIAITPLAFPLLVGPAEIGVMTTLASDMPDWSQRTSLFASLVVTSVLIGLTLWLSVPINRLIGKTGINVATRVMALIVASIGIHFIITGVKNQFPGLAHQQAGKRPTRMRRRFRPRRGRSRAVPSSGWTFPVVRTRRQVGKNL